MKLHGSLTITINDDLLLYLPLTRSYTHLHMMHVCARNTIYGFCYRCRTQVDDSARIKKWLNAVLNYLSVETEAISKSFNHFSYCSCRQHAVMVRDVSFTVSSYTGRILYSRPGFTILYRRYAGCLLLKCSVVLDRIGSVVTILRLVLCSTNSIGLVMTIRFNVECITRFLYFVFSRILTLSNAILQCP